MPTQPSQHTQPSAVAGGIPAPLGLDRPQHRRPRAPDAAVLSAAADGVPGGGHPGLTSIVGTFFIKDYLDLSAQFLAALGFWLMLPWALKMPLGHLVDLIWRHKAGLVYLGAGLIACSLLIMIGLLSDPAGMRSVMPAEAWFVVSALLAPIGYVLQDVVADAMTVEAVPRVDEEGKPLTEEERRIGHTTMQTLGRVAIIGGALLVSLVNVAMFSGVESMSAADKVAVYVQIYQLALIIPVVSVAGTVLASFLRRRDARRLAAHGLSREQVHTMLHGERGETEVNWWILGGGLVFAAFSIAMGLSQDPVQPGDHLRRFHVHRGVPDVAAGARAGAGCARHTGRHGDRDLRVPRRHAAQPGPGRDLVDDRRAGLRPAVPRQAGALSSGLTLLGLFLFRRFVAVRSIAYVVAFLTIAQALLALPTIGMYYGLHEWTAAHTGGVVDQRFIALIDTARGVAARAGGHDPDAGVDRQLGAGAAQGDLFRRDGLVHQPGAVAGQPRHQVSQHHLHRHARGEGPGHRRRDYARQTTASSATC